ncbi:sulfide:quinone oxidoreductase, mitochondrial [Daktulosphaira vitifoliae]|uniref:sulfide:quinone oxidoreductase, mitochondrial n=1 Tax=Daktulosphaira vitifoliae TaxID=58002 RepID=UPI0021A9D801|nr:sulfide:quinone oxidoreductase, mitochondrial [Daktulosphaira vitifoliae]
MFSNIFTIRHFQQSCKVLIVGGGSGGCTMAAKLAKYGHNVIVLEPNDMHYYQPLFTLIGGGMKTLAQACRPTKAVLPKRTIWIQDKVLNFHPECNKVTTFRGDTINYDFMLVAIGLQLKYDKILGLKEGLKDKNSGICTNYSSEYVEKTYKVIQNFNEGNAIFTFPNTPVKCPGAPQKIVYIFEDFLQKKGIRDKANVIYKTSTPAIFGVKKYANRLEYICETRNIIVDLRQNLIKIDSKKKEATFELLDQQNKTITTEYSLLHVTPPMAPPDVLIKSILGNENGYLDVDPYTLRHKVYNNIFGIGDCTSCPTSKTLAAVAAQSKIVLKNMINTMNGKELIDKYDGYTSCPLITGYNKCILAEFNYKLEPLETFPIDQGNELRSMFKMKNNILPFVYWNLMVNGYWNGPKSIRKILHLGLEKKI